MPKTNIYNIMKRPPSTRIGKWINQFRTWWRALPWVVKRRDARILAGFTKMKRKFDGSSIRGGLIIPHICTCGRYRPKSTRGIINPRCRHCNGEPQVKVYG